MKLFPGELFPGNFLKNKSVLVARRAILSIEFYKISLTTNYLFGGPKKLGGGRVPPVPQEITALPNNENRQN